MGDDDEPVVYVYVGVVESFTRTVAFPPRVGVAQELDLGLGAHPVQVDVGVEDVVLGWGRGLFVCLVCASDGSLVVSGHHLWGRAKHTLDSGIKTTQFSSSSSSSSSLVSPVLHLPPAGRGAAAWCRSRGSS